MRQNTLIRYVSLSKRSEFCYSEGRAKNMISQYQQTLLFPQHNLIRRRHRRKRRAAVGCLQLCQPRAASAARFLSNLEIRNISEAKIRDIVHLSLSRLAVRKDRSFAFKILRRDLTAFVNQQLKRVSIKTIPAFVEWLSHYNAVSHDRL